MNCLLTVNSGSPAVCCSASRSVTCPHAAGSSGRRWAIVSSSESSPPWTSASAAAPLNALETLAMRQASLGSIFALVSRSASPWLKTLRSDPRCTCA